MSDVHARLEGCFRVVFPGIVPTDVPQASPETLEAWDSVATVTLFAVIEEEFGVSLFDGDVEELVSFQAILSHLRSRLDRAAA